MEDNDAIITDAPAEDINDEAQGETETKDDARDERTRSLDEIADRIYKAQGLDSDETDKDEDGAAQPAAAESPQKERDDKGKFKAKDAEEPKYKVKIEGEEMELPLSEILKGYQKDSTASRRLQEVAQARKELEEERRLLGEEKAKVLSPAAPQNEIKAPSFDDSEAASKLYQSLFLGTEEEGKAALSEFLTRQRTSQQTAIQVEQVATQAAASARAQMQYETAERAFKAKHEFAKDPELYRMTLDAVKRTASESSTYEEAFEKAADLTINWMQERGKALGLTKNTAPTVDTPKQTVRKQSLDTVKSASARVPKPAVEKEETLKDILDEMRRKRGLPV